jgi:L-fuculose-phosphate aldolase
LKRKIVDVMRFMDDRGLNYGRAGNVSVRVGEDEVLITPSGVVKSAMSLEDIVLVSMDGRVLEGRHKPTVEMPLHLAIYRSYKHVKAVIHAHPTYTSVLAVARAPLPPIIEEMILYTGGDVRVAEYAPFGTTELAENAVKALEGRSAAILANHGVVTVGRDLGEALDVLVVVERAAQIYILSWLLGRVNVIPKDVVDLYRSMYLKRISEQEKWSRAGDSRERDDMSSYLRS